NTGSITARALTITAAGINKVYDATTAASVTLSDNRLAGDTLTTSYATAAFADKNVGTAKAVSVSGISLNGTDAANYNANTTATTAANITAATATVTADNKSRAYGAANPPLTSHYTGFVGGETASVVTGTPALSTTADTNSLPGGYPITVAAGSLSAANYTFTFVNGTLTVGKATLTVTANDATRAYGATNPVFTAAYSGFINNDDTNILSGTPDFNTSADTNSPVAGSPYTISMTNGTLN